MREINKNLINGLEYRIKDMERELDKIRDVMSGVAESFRPRIIDSENIIEPEKLKGLISALIDAFNEYRVNVEETDRLDEKMEKLYSDFLYLAMAGPSVRSILPDASVYFDHLMIPEKYSEIISLANYIFYSTRDDLLEHEAAVGFSEEEDGFFDLMGYGIWLLTDKSAMALIPEDERAKCEDMMRTIGREVPSYSQEDKNDESEKSEPEAEDEGQENGVEKADVKNLTAESLYDLFTPRNVVTEHPEKEYIPELPAATLVDLINDPEVDEKLRKKYESDLERIRHIESMNDDTEEANAPDFQFEADFYYGEYGIDKEMVDTEYEESKLAREAWKRQVKDGNEFIKAYLDFRASYFEMNHSNFAADVECMIKMFLCKYEVAPITLADNYDMLSRHISNVASRIQNESRRRRIRK
jgi:hypothetical protein